MTPTEARNVAYDFLGLPTHVQRQIGVALEMVVPEILTPDVFTEWFKQARDQNKLGKLQALIAAEHTET